MICQMLITTKEGQILAGTLVFKNGKVSSEPEEGYELLMADVLGTPNFDYDHKIILKDDPENWFGALPKQYSGSYLRALLVGDDSQPS